MLPFRLHLNSNEVAQVINFTDKNSKTFFGLTYDELCSQFDVDITEREYNEGKGFLDLGIYGDCYYRYYCASKVFTAFGMKVLNYSIYKKKAVLI